MRLVLLIGIYSLTMSIVLAETKTEYGSQAVFEALSAADWHEALSDARGGDPTELRFALSELEIAKAELRQLGAPSAELEPLRIAYESIASRIAMQQRLLMGFSPLFPMLLGHDDLLVRNGSHESAAIRRAVLDVASLIPGGALERAKTPVVIISRSGDAVAEMVAASAISGHSGLVTVGRVQIARALDLDTLQALRTGDPKDALESLITELSYTNANIGGLHLLRLEPMEFQGRVAAATVEYGTFRNGIFEPVIVRRAFAEAGAPGTAASLLIIFLMLPTQYLLVSMARRIDRDLHSFDPPPYWFGLLAAVVGYVTVWLGFQGLSGIFPGSDTLAWSLMGVQFLFAIAFTIAILPMFVVALGATRLPIVSGKLFNLDTLSVLLVGALFGAFALSAELTLARFGWSWVSAPLSTGAGSLLVLGITGALGFVRGLGRDRSWLAFGVVMLAGTGVTMLAGLRLELVSPIITALVVMAFAFVTRFTVAALERRTATARIARKSSETDVSSKRASLVERLQYPELALPTKLADPLNQAVQGAVGSEKDEKPFHWIQITGFSGSGKTRLLDELGVRIAPLLPGDALVISARCLSSDDGGSLVPYAPFRDMLREHLSVERMTDASNAMRELQSSAAASTLKTAMRAAGLGPLAGLVDGAGGSISAQVASDREISLSIAKTIVSLARDRPVVIQIDDLHYIDVSSVMAMRELVARLQLEEYVRVVFVTTHAADVAISADLKTLLEEMPDSRYVTHLALERIMPALGTELFDSLLKNVGFDLISRQLISEELTERVIDCPADILRFIRLADEAGLVEQSGNALMLKRNADLRLLPSPTDVRSAVDALTQGLAEGTVEVLRCAALQGLRFRPSILAEIFGLDLLVLLRELDQASERGIVIDIEDQDDYYEFSEVRTAALFKEDVRRSIRRRLGSGIPMPQAVRVYRRRYIQYASEALVERLGDLAKAPFEDISVIAGHARYLADSHPELTVYWSLMHGHRCLDRGMSAAAQTSFEYAWEAVVTHAGPSISYRQRLNVASGMIDSMLRNGFQGLRLVEVLSAAERWLDEYEEDGSESLKVGWLLRGAEVAYRRREFDKCREYAEGVLNNRSCSLSEKMRAEFLRAASLPLDQPQIRSKALISVIQNIDSEIATEKIVGTIRHSLLRIKAESLNTLGMNVIHGERDAQRALKIFQDALRINQGEEAPDGLGARIALGGLGDSLVALGRVDEAEARYRENLSESLDTDDLAGVVRMSSAIGALLLDKVEKREGNGAKLLEEANSLYMKSLQSSDRQDNPVGQAFALSGLARHRRLSGLPMNDIELLVKSRLVNLTAVRVAQSILCDGIRNLKTGIDESSPDMLILNTLVNQLECG